MTGLFGPPLEIARQIQQRVRSEIGVGINIGIGPSKLVAKMASELEKPNKIIVLSLEEWPQKIWPLPVQELFGVGNRIGGWLKRYGVYTIGELAALPVERLTRPYGVIGEILHYSARGLDFSPVDPRAMEVVKSVGNQITLPRDYRGYELVKVVILELAEEVSCRARKIGHVGRTVGLGLKDPLFNSIFRTKALYNYTDITNEVYEAGVQLLTKHWPRDLMVRAVGLSLSGLVPASEKQLQFFTQREKLEQVDRATDRIRSRWGRQSIKRAVSLTGLGVFRNER